MVMRGWWSTVSLGKIVGIGLPCLLLLVAGGIWYVLHAHSRPAIPRPIIDKAHFTVYIPKKLPGNYHLQTNSFSLQEESGILIFAAKDATGGSIVFTEQQNPANLNFNDFYKEQVKNAQVLDDTPYPSVAGKSLDDKAQILSIVAGTTWVFVTTSSPLDQIHLQRIAQSMYPVH